MGWASDFFGFSFFSFLSFILSVFFFFILSFGIEVGMEGSRIRSSLTRSIYLFYLFISGFILFIFLSILIFLFFFFLSFWNAGFGSVWFGWVRLGCWVRALNGTDRKHHKSYDY